MLNIAQISPLAESVPPKGYGGTERIVSYLTEELVKRGHDVTLFASADSVTSARLRPMCSRSLRMDSDSIDKLAAHVLMVEQVFQTDGFDILHSHIDYLPFSLIRRTGIPAVATMHGRLDIKDVIPVYREFSDIPLVSISNAQRVPISWANWAGTVYHGLPSDLYHFNEQPDDYLVYIGRLSPEKRVDDAIDIATKAQRRLIIAGKVDPTEKKYFETELRPLLDNPFVEFIGEIAERKKEELLSQAAAFVFPIDWPEPFGLVMIESMACGTPVIARSRGSVPEIIDPGVTGFLTRTTADAVRAVHRLDTIDRHRCRATFESRYTVETMTDNYLRIYEKVIGKQQVMPWVK